MAWAEKVEAAACWLGEVQGVWAVMIIFDIIFFIIVDYISINCFFC